MQGNYTDGECDRFSLVNIEVVAEWFGFDPEWLAERVKWGEVPSLLGREGRHMILFPLAKRALEKIAENQAKERGDATWSGFVPPTRRGKEWNDQFSVKSLNVAVDHPEEIISIRKDVEEWRSGIENRVVKLEKMVYGLTMRISPPTYNREVK